MNAKKLDKLIEAAFYKHCQNVQIGVLDIGKVFTAGRQAFARTLAETSPSDPDVARKALTAIEAAVIETVGRLSLKGGAR